MKYLRFVPVIIIGILLQALVLYAFTGTYFGEVDAAGNLSWSPSTPGGWGTFFEWDPSGYSCPSSGTQTVTSLDFIGATINGSPVTFNLGLYTLAGSKVGETGPIAVGIGVPAWVTNTVSLSCTGGSTYILAIAIGGGNSGAGNPQYDAARTNWDAVTTDYSAALPSTLPSPGTTNNHPLAVRALATGGGGSGKHPRLFFVPDEQR